MQIEEMALHKVVNVFEALPEEEKQNLLKNHYEFYHFFVYLQFALMANKSSQKSRAAYEDMIKHEGNENYKKLYEESKEILRQDKMLRDKVFTSFITEQLK